MTKEVPQPHDEFGFTERERLFSRVSHARFKALIGDPEITIHRMEESPNSYGEFLFVTASRPTPTRRIWVSFYGLGYHEHRERWVSDEWFWYHANPLPETLEQRLSKEEAQELIEKRRESIAPHLSQATQSGRGRLFEMLADLTEEDGALAELEDLDDVADWLADGLE